MHSNSTISFTLLLCNPLLPLLSSTSLSIPPLFLSNPLRTPINSPTNHHPKVGLGYLKILAPPDKILRWLEAKLNLLGRLPHYVSIDQKTYGRYGVLPSSTVTSSSAPTATAPPVDHHAVPMAWLGTGGAGQRLGP